MSGSGLDKAPIRTADQARADIARKDRIGWYGDDALCPSRIFAYSGREVARCFKREDRDAIVAMARSWDVMKDAMLLARHFVQNDRDTFFDCRAVDGNPATLGTLEHIHLGRLDAVLAAIDAALAAAGTTPSQTAKKES
jgi:hypothetical protein